MQVFNREHYEHVRISNDIARIAGYSKAKVASVIVKAVLRVALFPLSIVLMLAMVILRIVLIIGCWIAKGFGTACAYLEDVFGFWQTLFGLGYTFGNNPLAHLRASRRHPVLPLVTQAQERSSALYLEAGNRSRRYVACITQNLEPG